MVRRANLHNGIFQNNWMNIFWKIIEHQLPILYAKMESKDHNKSFTTMKINDQKVQNFEGSAAHNILKIGINWAVLCKNCDF